MDKTSGIQPDNSVKALAEIILFFSEICKRRALRLVVCCCTKKLEIRLAVCHFAECSIRKCILLLFRL